MAVVAVFFKLSMSVRDLHNHLVEDKGIPSWASYGLFAGVTLALGCVLGFVSFLNRNFCKHRDFQFIVIIIDQVFPTGPRKSQQAKKTEKKDAKKGTLKYSDSDF